MSEQDGIIWSSSANQGQDTVNPRYAPRVNALSYTFVVEVIVPVDGNITPYTGAEVLDRIDSIFVDDDDVDVDVRLVDAESI